MHSGLVAVFVLLTLGCIVVWIGLFSPYFITQEVTPIHEAHIGLYTLCDINGDCSSLINAEPPLDPGWLKAVQGFGILGTLCVSIGWSLLLCWLCNKQTRNRWIKYTIIVLIFVTVICYIIMLSLWEDNFYDVWPYSYEIWGFIIPWIGVVLILIAGCIFLHPAVSQYTEQQGSQPSQPWRNWGPSRPSAKAHEYDIPRPPITRVQSYGYDQQPQAHSFQPAGYSSQQLQSPSFQPTLYNSDRLSGISSVMVTQ